MAQHVGITIHADDAEIVKNVRDQLHIKGKGLSQAIQYIIREHPVLTAQVESLKAEVAQLTASGQTRKGARA
jgi:hypothetical protein